MNRLLKQLYGLSALSGMVLALPPLLLMAWYAWSAFALLDSYRRALDPGQPIDLELFQIALHDELTRDLRRLSMPERGRDSQIPTFSLSMTRGALDRLRTPTSSTAAGGYAPALLEKDGRVHEVDVRYRGTQPWHNLGSQRSMKVRLDRKDLVDDVRVFNLLNDPTPFGLEDRIILDISRELGLLTPEYHPVWVRINNHDMGVHRFESQADESLLRHNRRMPGSMFSGDAEGLRLAQGQRGSIFFGREGWQQIAWKEADSADDYRELDRLLEAVNEASFAAFAHYARESIDLERYAEFDALDVVFGGNQHDYLTNHKFYADPYRGKLEPIAWSFRGFQHEETFNLIDHPLLIRLKSTPGFLAMRDRAVYRLLLGKASTPSIRERVGRGLRELAPDLAADPYWDAYKLLPRASRFHRFFVRPMTISRWMLAAEYELAGHSNRARYLLDELERSGTTASARIAEDDGRSGHDRRNGHAGRNRGDGGNGGAGRRGHVVTIELTVSRHDGVRVRRVRALGDCADATVQLFADADLDGRLRDGADALIASGLLTHDLELNAYDELTPRMRLVPHPEPSSKRGWVRVETIPTTHRYFLRAPSSCSVTRIALDVDNLVTDESTPIELVPSSSRQHDLAAGALRPKAKAPTWVSAEVAAGVAAEVAEEVAAEAEDALGSRPRPTDPSRGPVATDVLRFEVGEESPHPWSFPQPPGPHVVPIGPGIVKFESSRTFGEHETVEVRPKTTILLGQGVSLVFRGPVFFRGTSRDPIRIGRLDPNASFGGIALQGPRTSGSRLYDLTIEGGSRIDSAIDGSTVGRPAIDGSAVDRSKLDGSSVEYTATLNFHDTEDIELRRVTVVRPEGRDGTADDAREAEDVIHVNQVNRIRLEDVIVLGASRDGIDLEFASAELLRVKVQGAKDDCLDMMGSVVTARDMILVGCRNNAISAGEATRLDASGLVAADVGTGVLAKNASKVRLIRSLITRSEIGLWARRREIRYGGRSEILLSDVHVVDSQKTYDADGGSTIDVAELRTNVPRAGELEHVLRHVLGLGDWSKLDDALEGTGEGEGEAGRTHR